MERHELCVANVEKYFIIDKTGRFFYSPSPPSPESEVMKGKDALLENLNLFAHSSASVAEKNNREERRKVKNCALNYFLL